MNMLSYKDFTGWTMYIAFYNGAWLCQLFALLLTLLIALVHMCQNRCLTLCKPKELIDKDTDKDVFISN